MRWHLRCHLNTEKREGDRKRINLENDIKEIKRKNMGKVQIGRGFEKLYGKVKDCDAYNLQNVMMGLSEDDMYRICNCIQLYLNGEIDIDDENIRKVVDEDEYLLKDMVDVASRRYTIEEKKKFLCNGPGCQGDNVAKLVCCHLLPKFIESIDDKMEENNKQILRLKRKIN